MQERGPSPPIRSREVSDTPYDEHLGELISAPEMRFSPLSVNVDWMELVEHYGEAEAWIVLGKLKDFLV